MIHSFLTPMLVSLLSYSRCHRNAIIQLGFFSWNPRYRCCQAGTKYCCHSVECLTAVSHLDEAALESGFYLAGRRDNLVPSALPIQGMLRYRTLLHRNSLPVTGRFRCSTEASLIGQSWGLFSVVCTSPNTRYLFDKCAEVSVALFQVVFE